MNNQQTMLYQGVLIPRPVLNVDLHVLPDFTWRVVVHIENGTVDVPNDEGGADTAVIYSGEHGAISVYPGPERFALANHIEAGAIEKYGQKEGLLLALRMYQDMVVCDDEYGFRLSAMGREGFNMLHDGFIEQIHTEGMPDMPVMH